MVWLGKSELARTKGRTGRKGPGTKMRTRSKRRRNVAEGFAASRAMLGADEVGANPVSPFFTTWIDTLNGGARHQGHNALPQLPPAQRVNVSPWAARKCLAEPHECEDCCAGVNESQRERDSRRQKIFEVVEKRHPRVRILKEPRARGVRERKSTVW